MDAAYECFTAAHHEGFIAAPEYLKDTCARFLHVYGCFMAARGCLVAADGIFVDAGGRLCSCS